MMMVPNTRTHTQVPNLLDSLSGIYQLLDARVGTFSKLCRLQGKLDLMIAQTRAVGTGSGVMEVTTPLVSVTAGGQLGLQTYIKMTICSLSPPAREWWCGRATVRCKSTQPISFRDSFQ